MEVVDRLEGRFVDCPPVLQRPLRIAVRLPVDGCRDPVHGVRRSEPTTTAAMVTSCPTRFFGSPSLDIGPDISPRGS